MAFTFETIGNNTFLVYGIEPEDTLDTMTLGMITKNKIPGIASALYTQVNRDCFLKYNVTAKITVRKFFSGAVNRQRLLGVFSSITAALAAAEEYMIDLDSLLLNLDDIYVDVASSCAEVICLPVMNRAVRTDMGMFFKNIMFTTQFDQTENCDYVAGIINYLNSAPTFVAEDFWRLLEGLKGQFQPLQTPPAQYGTSAVAQFQEQTAGMQTQIPAGVQTQIPSGSTTVPVREAAAGFAIPGQQPQKAPVSPMSIPPAASASPASIPPAASASSASIPPAASASSASIPSAIPVPAPPPLPVQRSEEAGQAAGEKGMSVFYLLQHYNKENAEAYKAQKNAQKNAKKDTQKSATKNDKKSDKKNDKKKNKKGQSNNAGFLVPGQQVPQPPQGGQTLQQPQSQGMQFAQQAQGGQTLQQPQFPGMQFTQQAQGGQTLQQPQFQGMQFTQPSVQPVSFASDNENFGDTVVMGQGDYGDDTVVLGNVQAAALKPYLLRSSNNEKILLEKEVFRIGKERSYVDYCISNNATISRSHADILYKNGQFYIIDNNSTNHTYINGQMIPSNVEIALVHGTKIRLSDEEFEFRTF